MSQSWICMTPLMNTGTLRVKVLKRAGPYYILKPSTLADRDDLLQAGPWNINGVLFLLRPWVPDMPFHKLDFSWAEMWIQMGGELH